MTLIERYLFRQLLGPTIWAMIALAGVGILSQSLASLDLIIEQRQSAWVFIKVTALAMPTTLALIVPLALFVAALISLNRLQSEHEIVVCYAGGVSRWKIASPVLRLASAAALLTLIVNLWVAPWATLTMNAEINAARADLAAALVRDGQFTHPAAGLTVYAEDVQKGGRMTNLFIHQEDQKNGTSATYTAKSGQMIKQNGRPLLVMERGSMQELNKDGVLNYLSFERYPFDLQPFIGGTARPQRKANDRYMTELLNPAPTDVWGQANKGKLLAEAWSRVASPLYCLAFAAIAIIAVLGGAFSRLGYGKRIAIASGVALVVRVLGLVILGACAKNPALNPIQVAIPLLSLIIALGVFVGGRMRLPKVSLSMTPAQTGAV
jgi:lipopolysaccharide export system permease protein